MCGANVVVVYLFGKRFNVDPRPGGMVTKGTCHTPLDFIFLLPSQSDPYTLFGKFHPGGTLISNILTQITPNNYRGN